MLKETLIAWISLIDDGFKLNTHVMIASRAVLPTAVVPLERRTVAALFPTPASPRGKGDTSRV